MELPSRYSIRCQNYDYSQQGIYYITMCLEERKLLLGNIQAGIMLLNEYGIIAEQQLRALINKFPNINLDEYVIMPDHVHVIIEINKVNELAKQIATRRNMLLPKIIGFYKMNVAKQINLVRKAQGFMAAELL